ncbi:MAG: YraN family protein [Bacteroidota bacterium]
MSAHNELGKQGEQLAKEHLIASGYSILSLNYRFQKAEVDIIAKIGDTYVFVEVKTRQTEAFGLPETFVSNKKQQLFAKAAEAYCDENNHTDIDIRYDIISVIINQFEKKVEHFEDAFFPDNLGMKRYGM